MKKAHTFHIPVMGTCFTIDSPIKVAKYGISSVISLVDDTLIESMRKYYCQKSGEPYQPITKKDDDFRAKRITAYLDLVDKIVMQQFAELKASAFEVGTEITKYFELLPASSPLKLLYNLMLKTNDPDDKAKMQDRLRDTMEVGSIDVNIMTKLDRANLDKEGKPLPGEFSDALAALRGYAESKLKSAMVLSAGLNQKLYSYMEGFKDFYADTTGQIKKKIVLKVSDYRSSFIQGKFFAKKGLWVSEYRVESGLNCGGHAFATNGTLLGPILDEFKNKRDELISKLHTVYNNALKMKNLNPFSHPHEIIVTAQGGIGTHKEDIFLQSHFQLDGTGWGTPILLCPEASTLDDKTMKKLTEATSKDLYLSDVSPLGVPFQNLRTSSSEEEKQRRANTDQPGSPCVRSHLCFNTEFTDKPVCTASRAYQKLKLEQLKNEALSEECFKAQRAAMIDKSCICYELGNGALIKYGIVKEDNHYVAVCPGPNLAYFSDIISLKDIAEHIYGHKSILNATYRPNMFIEELMIYIEYFMKEIKQAQASLNDKQKKSYQQFLNNLLNGVDYYKGLFPKMLAESKEYHRKAIDELHELRTKLEDFVNSISFLNIEAAPPPCN